jgi:hypothetical protein
MNIINREHLQGLCNLCAVSGRLIRSDVRSTVRDSRDLACGVDLWGVPLRFVLEVDLVALVVGLGLGESDLRLREYVSLRFDTNDRGELSSRDEHTGKP